LINKIECLEDCGEKGRCKEEGEQRSDCVEDFEGYEANVPLGRSEGKSEEFIAKGITCIRSHLKHRTKVRDKQQGNPF
jgi:hypothetical protein